MKGSLRAYAQHRKQGGLSGGSLAAVQKALHNHRIVREPDGAIDFDKADLGWRDNSDQTKLRAAKTQPAENLTRLASQAKPTIRRVPSSDSPTDIEEEAGGRPGDDYEPEAKATFAEAQRRREWVRVHRDELALSRERGDLAPLAEVNAWVAGMIIRAREILIRIGPELRDRLAQNANPIECERLVMTEIHRALNDLAQFQPAKS